MPYNAADDIYLSVAQGVMTPGRCSRVITPSANNISPVAKGLILLTSGNITFVPIDNADADTISLTGLPAGYVLPFIVRRVTAATATVATIEG